MPAPFTAVIGAQGITLRWGTTGIGVTRMQYNKSAAAEIDTTGMNATVYQDANNTSRKFVRKSVDYAVVDLGELSCDFYGRGGFDESQVGGRNAISIDGLTAFQSQQAYLTQISTEVVAGDLIRGSCTFRLSAD
jgi:hypothetical protein